jgi:hypothetical protein
MVLENMKCNLKNEKMCRDNAHGTLVFLAFAQIRSAAASRSPSARRSISLLSICRAVTALLRASPAARTFRPVR